MKAKPPFLFVCASLLLLLTGCDMLVSRALRHPFSWQAVQAVGGLALGQPQRDERGHVVLPLRCNVSGLEQVTVKPTTLNSALVCEPPLVRVRGSAIYLTVRATVATSRNKSCACTSADLGRLAAGEYSVIYRSPGGEVHPLGSIQAPPVAAPR
ncbi:MAG: hypothetical protein ACO1TE_22830 [Prosthecobacter sp.]